MSEEKEFNIDSNESAIEKLRRDAPVMANFVDAVHDRMANIPMPKAWAPRKLEFYVEQLEFGAPQLTINITKLLNDGWEVFKTESYRQWLVVFFARKVEIVDSRLDK